MRPRPRATCRASTSTASSCGWSAVRQVHIGDGTGQPLLLRARVRNTYDEGKHGGAAYHLVTTTIADGYDPVTQTGHDPTKTKYSYDAIDGAGSTAPSSGWVLKQPTVVTVAPDTDLSTSSRVLYDDRGRVLRSSKPGSNGSDAATTLTVYYTAGANPSDAACGNRPEWAGQPCMTRAAGSITGHNPALAPSELPTKRITGYNMWGSPTTVTETVGASSRTSTTTYDNADRVQSVALVGTSGTGQALPTAQTVYDPQSGDVTAVQALNAAGSVTSQVTKAYDALGRLTSYTDGSGATTTTQYDRWGKPTTSTQVIAGVTTTTTYTYDATAEPRGYVTSITDSVAGTISATYGPDGQLTSQTLPGGVTLTITYDPARVPVARTYTRDSDQQVVFSDSVVENHQGQWITHNSTTGTSTYAYDALGRLTRSTSTANGQCTTRGYGFAGSLRSNRTQSAAATGATCPTATLATTASYDSADRLVSTATDPAGQAWTYDAFGRVTTLPDAGGAIGIGYYVNDLVASQTQPSVAQMSWSLDPLQRRSVNTQQEWVNGAWAESATKTMHYANDSDEPTWISEDITNPADVTRYEPPRLPWRLSTHGG